MYFGPQLAMILKKIFVGFSVLSDYVLTFVLYFNTLFLFIILTNLNKTLSHEVLVIALFRPDNPYLPKARRAMLSADTYC